MAQSTKANGFNAFSPTVGDLELAHFTPDFVEDHFVDTALTIQGKISNFDVTYAGAYLKRHDITQTDYSDYSLAYDIYASSYTAPIVNNAGQHINPTQFIKGRDNYEKISNELRVTSPQDWVVHFIVGGFWQRQMHDIEQNYQVANLAGPGCTYTPPAGQPGCSLWVTGWQDTWWLTEQQRVDRDYAIFGEATWDITSNLSLLAGLRHFKYDNSLEGFRGYGINNPLGIASGLGEAGVCDFTIQFHNAPCLSFNKSTSGTGNTPKFTLTYKFGDRSLVYATYSKGFRPGGINRVGDLPPYSADFLQNYEIGWKTTWLDNHLRYNGAFFYEDWTNFQFAFLGANGLTRIANAGGAISYGMENELQWLVTQGLTIAAGLTLMDPHLSQNYCGELDSNGKPITDNPCPVPGSNPPETFAPLSPTGTQLPGTSKVKGNLTARYDFPLGSWQSYGQASYAYQSSQWADLRLEQRGEIGQQPAFSTLDLATGIERNGLAVDLFLTNVFDERGQTFRFTQCGSCSGINNYVVPTQPRTVALRFTQRF